MNQKPIILFDGVCNLCNGAVQFVIRHDKDEKFLFAALQSSFGQQLLQRHQLPSQQLDSVILLQDEKVYTKSTAALKVCRQLNGASKLMYFFIIVPKFIRDGVYGWIASHRYKWFGKRESCIIPTKELNAKFLE